MTLQEFADRYQVRVKKDSLGDPIIPGKVKGAKWPEDNHHIFALRGKLSLYLNMPTLGRFNNAVKKLKALGAWSQMCGKMDGFLGFDPENAALVKLVLKVARIRVRRQLSEEQKAAVRARFAKK